MTNEQIRLFAAYFNIVEAGSLLAALVTEPFACALAAIYMLSVAGMMLSVAGNGLGIVVWLTRKIPRPVNDGPLAHRPRHHPAE